LSNDEQHPLLGGDILDLTIIWQVGEVMVIVDLVNVVKWILGEGSPFARNSSRICIELCAASSTACYSSMTSGAELE
jgi:hypothetical protein